jgi:hypothetical protein
MKKKEVHVANMLRRALDGIREVRDVFTLCRFRLNNHKLPVEYERGKTYLGNSEFVIYVTQQILEMSSIIY